MPKYLFEARYTSEGAIGLAKEGGTGRRDAVKKHLDEIGGKLESMYFAFGDVDSAMGALRAGAWTAAVLVIHAIMVGKCRQFLERPMNEVSARAWRLPSTT